MGGSSEDLNVKVCGEQDGPEMTDWGEAGHRPWLMTHKDLAPSLRKMAPLFLMLQSLWIHRGNLIPFLCYMFNWWWLLSCSFCLEGSRHRQRTYAHELLGGMDKNAFPHPTATYIPFLGVTLRYAVLTSLATKGVAVAWMSLTQLGEGGWAAFSAGA